MALKKSTAVEISEKLVNEEFQQVLDGIELFVLDLLLYKYTNDVSMLRYLDEQRVVIGQSITNDRLWILVEKVRQARVGLVMQHRLNVQLLLEDMLCE